MTLRNLLRQSGPAVRARPHCVPPILPFTPVPPRGVAALLLFAALCPISPAAAPTEPWTAATPAELAADASALQPDAVAEVLLWRVEIDDKRYPSDRKITEYRRYKLFAPDRADHIMRIARTDIVVNGHAQYQSEIRARLTQPDGTARELGKESILERLISKTRMEPRAGAAFGPEVVRTEKYLAVAGAERGAILEVHVATKDTYSDAITRQVLQLDSVPVRKLEYVFRSGNPTEYDCRFFVLNTERAKASDDTKARTFTVTATDLPALLNEPFSGVASDYALTMFACYTPYSMGAMMSSGGGMSRDIDTKAGPWAVPASVMRWIEEDRTAPTSRVKKTAAELVQGATTELEKAQRIHRRAQSGYLEFFRRAKTRASLSSRPQINPSLDMALDLGKEPHEDLRAIDFLYLALSLYRAAGLHAELLLLPDREFSRLDKRLASQMFLQDTCAAVRIGDKWHFSMPHTATPMAFGELPWQNQGQGGLLARENKQDFIDVPLDPPTRTAVGNLGIFTLDASGTLTGEFRRIVTGQAAIKLRGELINQDTEHQHTVLKKIYATDLKGADLTVVKIQNVENPDLPLDITYKLEWPGYAVFTSDRLIVRASVFRAQTETPFTSSSRRNRVIFPYRWQEMDRVALRLPPGYEPESMASPASHPGDVLGYKVAYSYEAPKRLVHMRREFQSAAIMVPVESYADVKKWYDAVTNSDQHELVFIKTTTPAEAGTAGAQ